MLKFDNVSFSYQHKEILRDFSMTLQRGEIVAIMGESGLGKSTLLNLAAGLLKPQKGTVVRNTDRISYAFQEPRLLPHLTVLDNVNAVLSAKSDTIPAATEALAFVGLSDSATLYPRELSGGMKSRVSLARALAYQGDLYLLDEPFAALNEELRIDLLERLKCRIKSSGASALFVTHQYDDAVKFADRILSL